MPQCPVCETRFVNGKTTTCPICNWDIQELSLMVGLIPEVTEKEATRLTWAKKLWQTSQHQQSQLQQTQAQLQQAKERLQQVEAQPQETPLPESPLVEPPLLEPPLVEPPQDTHPTPASSPPLPRPVIALDLATPQIAAAVAPAIPLSTPSEEWRLAPTLQKTEVNPGELGVGTPIDEWLLAPALARPHPITLPPLPPSCELQSLCFETTILTPQGRSVQKQTVTAFGLPLSPEVSLELVVIPGGQFWMGSPDTEAERDPNEGPQHQVAIAPFSMSKFPITQAQWRIVASWPKVKRSLSLYPADFEGDDRPVEQVTWYDCIEFCDRLSQYTGQTYRLPSEAEWEYACRAGTSTPFYWGDTVAPDLANYDGNFVYGDGSTGLYRQQTTPLHAFHHANGFGLFDLHGNVWEWCLDSWHDSYQDAPTDGRAWEDLDQPYRVLRGGAWYCLPGLCRSAQRHWNQPDTGGSGIGFRVVCEIN